MNKLKFLAAALIAAAMLATPAMAHESHVSSRYFAPNADASTTSGAHYVRGGHFRGYDDHDVWGQWGTYYGPMVPPIP
jgi:hypothetical protein